MARVLDEARRVTVVPSLDLSVPRPWVLVPVQVKVREFEAKVLVGAAAAERGMGLVLGTHRGLRPSLHRFPPAVILDYSAALPFSRLYRSYRAAGHAVVASEEEGLIEVPTDAVAEADAFFAWGEAEAGRVIAASPDASGRVRVTGNARFDLLRPEVRAIHERDAGGYRARFGRYLLVNTNFAANVQFGVEVLQQINRLDTATFTDEDFRHYEQRDAHSARIFASFQQMVRDLVADFPDHTLVLRPHPSEDVPSWERACAGVPRVHIDNRGNVVGWIAGADAVVHNSCTTAIESHLLGVPVISYRPVADDRFDWDLPNLVSTQVTTYGDLVAALHAAIDAGHEPSHSRHPALVSHIAALDGALAADRIAERLLEIARPSSVLRWDARRAMQNRADVGFITFKHLGKLALRKTHIPLSFESQKNSGWSVGEVHDVLHRLRAATGRFERVAVRQLARGITAIGPAVT